jgi:hypothetical protein
MEKSKLNPTTAERELLTEELSKLFPTPQWLINVTVEELKNYSPEDDFEPEEKVRIVKVHSKSKYRWIEIAAAACMLFAVIGLALALWNTRSNRDVAILESIKLKRQLDDEQKKTEENITALQKLKISVASVHDRATLAEATTAALETQIASLESKNALISGEIQKALAAQEDSETLGFVAFNRDQKVRMGKVKVDVQNITWPVSLVWDTGVEKHSKEVMRNGSTFELPSGDVTINVRPHKTHAFWQGFQVVLNGDYKGTSFGGLRMKLSRGDTLRIILEQPLPPWNATMVRINGQWVLITNESPLQDRSILDYFKNPAADAKVNCLEWYWSELGTKKTAQEMAKWIASTVNAPEYEFYAWNRDYQFSVVTPMDGDRPIEEVRKASQEELQSEIESALKSMENRIQPNGRSAGSLLTRAQIARQVKSLEDPLAFDPEKNFGVDRDEIVVLRLYIDAESGRWQTLEKLGETVLHSASNFNEESAYNAACALTVASNKIAESDLSKDGRQLRVDKFRSEAISILAKFLKSKSLVKQAMMDTDLDSLRDNKEFRELLEKLSRDEINPEEDIL